MVCMLRIAKAVTGWKWGLPLHSGQAEQRAPPVQGFIARSRDAHKPVGCAGRGGGSQLGGEVEGAPLLPW